MATHAYLDKNRTKRISANEAKEVNNIDKKYYCLDPCCNAILTLKANSSIAVPNPYFSALPSSPHAETCEIGKAEKEFYEQNFDPTLFIFRDIINEYMTNNFTKIKGRLSTISGIYYMCKTTATNERYGDTEIWNILCDVRSNPRYLNGIFGPHLIECKYYSYNKETQIINFQYPLDDSLKNQCKLKIHIPDRNLFFEIKETVYNNNNHPIILVGDWAYNNFYSKTTITNRYQIYIPKKS